MLKIENAEVVGWSHAVRGMRNPMNSWDKSDSGWPLYEKSDEMAPGVTYSTFERGDYVIGKDDLDLMSRLRNSGTDHRKFMRMIVVYFDVTAPLFWWKEFDTYKVATVRNSCSTMHKIHVKPFETSDFSHEGISEVGGIVERTFTTVVETCEWLRHQFNKTQEKKYWRALIELLPDSFNMRATIMLNYEVLANQYRSRVKIPHKLVEWRTYGDFIESLPHSELITGEVKNEPNI